MTHSTPSKIKIRGLFRIAGWILVGWGSGMSFLGLVHAFFGEPEANIYSLEKWQFVTQEQWLRWSGFEMTYGLACIGIALVVWELAKRFPETVLQEKQKNDFVF
jgi:hypothetical protein